MKWKSLLLALVLVLGLLSASDAANDYYTHGSYPSPNSPATSAGLRAELDSISVGFDKLPPLTGNNGRAVIVNGGGTGLTVTNGELLLGGDLTITGSFQTTLVAGAATTLTLPLSSGTLATLNGIETFTNKTYTNPILNGVVTGSYTFNNATIASPVFSGTASGSLLFATFDSPNLIVPQLTSPAVVFGALDISDPDAGQILFPAVQNSSGNPNVLDDYEEGNWTPSVGGNATYSVQIGFYTKVGRVVTVNCWMSITTIGTGNVNTITGLPFLVGANTFLTASPLYSALATNTTTLIAYGAAGGNSIELRGSTAAASGLSTNTWLGNGSSIIFTATYTTQS
jgi:hypothetical protein